MSIIAPYHGKWRQLTDAQRRMLTVVMRSPVPVTLSDIKLGANVTLALVLRLLEDGLIAGDADCGYRATPDGAKSLLGECELPSRQALWPNGAKQQKPAPVAGQMRLW